MLTMSPLALYVHLPWCVRKCPYCDFNSHEGRGAHGFGYDPLFLPDGHTLSAAELDPVLKNRISHRGRALAVLRDRLVEATRC